MRASAFLPLLLAIPSALTAQLSCGNVAVEARALHYCSAGTGKPTVVFEAGIPGTAAAWDSVVGRVAGFAKAISYDRAGHGASPATPGARSPADVASDLRRLLDELGERDPVVLVGRDEGTWFVRAFADHFPERVRALILVDPPHEDFEARAAVLLTTEEKRQRDSALAARIALLDDASRREREGILATPPGAWSFLPEVPLVVVSLRRREFTPANRAEELQALWSQLETALADRVRDGRVRVLPPGDADAIAGEVRDIIGRSKPDGLSTGTILTVLGLLVSLLVGGPGAYSSLMQILERRRTKPHAVPHQITVTDLIGKDTPVAGRAVALVSALNERAVAVYRSELRGEPRNPQAQSIWNRTWPEHDWQAQRAWVEPVDTGPGRDVTLTQRVLRMLRTPEKAAGDHQIWVLGQAGAGKSTFMNRLFFEALGVAGNGPPENEPGLHPLPVPVFLQARNVSVQQIERLLESGDGNRAFVEGWLANRQVSIPAEMKDALIADFTKSLADGTMVLFIDGFDELVDLGLTDFFFDLLRETASWVCAERSDRKTTRPRGRSVELPRHWSGGQITRYLRARWPDRPEWGERVFAHLRRETSSETAGPGEVGDEDGIRPNSEHILLIPRYLDLFLGQLEKSPELPAERRLRELSRGGPELAAEIVTLALARLSTTERVSDHEINARLFDVAAARVMQAEYVLPKEKKDATWDRILQMTEFVSHVSSSGGHKIRITHPALVDYFLAGKIASELRAGSEALSQGDRHWSAGLLAGVSAWLRRYDDPETMSEIWRRIQAADSRIPVTNLLELVIRLDVDARGKQNPEMSLRDRRRDVLISDKDLSDRNLEGADLHLVSFARCRWNGANLTGADLQLTTFHQCELIGTTLTGANALGADFARCTFLDDRGFRVADVQRFQIEAAEFHEGTPNASDVGEQWLLNRGAIAMRTRYGGEFGRIFFSRQRAFLGKAAESLEQGTYRKRIAAALTRCPPDAPTTLVDLMAGGGNEWLAGLVTSSPTGAARFPTLRVLGIDRDEPQLRELKRKFPEVFQWYQKEIGDDGIDLPQIIGEAFGKQGERIDADVIVARKAIHELRRPLQAKLIAQCFTGLRSGGEFVLFADSPGPMTPAPDAMNQDQFLEIDQRIRGLLSDRKTPMSVLRQALLDDDLKLLGDERDQARFCNLWVLLKDWANDNYHELRNRWFSSAGEIRYWAAQAGFTEIEKPDPQRYRLEVARFNERGIQRAINHLERNGPDIIKRDGRMLADWLSGSNDERQDLLRQFSAHHLATGKPLAESLEVESVTVDWGDIHPDLRWLDIPDRTSLAFAFPVHVMSFRKP